MDLYPFVHRQLSSTIQSSSELMAYVQRQLYPVLRELRDTFNSFSPLSAVSVENLAALRSGAPLTVASTVNLMGHTTPGDGGGGVFTWLPTDTSADNGGTIVASAGVAVGRWRRVYSGPLDIRWFGAVGNGVVDDGPAILAAASVAKLRGGTVFTPAAMTCMIHTPVVVDMTGVAHSIRFTWENAETSIWQTDVPTGTVAAPFQVLHVIAAAHLIIERPQIKNLQAAGSGVTELIRVDDSVYWEILSPKTASLAGTKGAKNRVRAISIINTNPALVPPRGEGLITNPIHTNLGGVADYDCGDSVWLFVDGLTNSAPVNNIRILGHCDIEECFRNVWLRQCKSSEIDLSGVISGGRRAVLELESCQQLRIGGGVQLYQQDNLMAGAVPGQTRNDAQQDLVVTAATNATPVQITISNPLPASAAVGDRVTVANVLGNTGANGTFPIGSIVNPTAFTLAGSVGTGAYAGGGTVGIGAMFLIQTGDSLDCVFDVNLVNILGIADKWKYCKFATASLARMVWRGTGDENQWTYDESLQGFDVKAWGAYGNGSHDDTAYIQAALNYAHSRGGGRVYFPSGNYLISAALVGYSNIALVGSGVAATTITQSVSGQATVMFTDASRPTIRDMTLSGGAYHCVVIASTSGSGGVAYPLLENVEIVKFGDNVTPYYGVWLEVQGTLDVTAPNFFNVKIDGGAGRAAGPRAAVGMGGAGTGFVTGARFFGCAFGNVKIGVDAGRCQRARSMGQQFYSVTDGAGGGVGLLLGANCSASIFRDCDIVDTDTLDTDAGVGNTVT